VGHAGAHFIKADAVQVFGHDGGSAKFAVAQFGVLMEVAAPDQQLRFQRRGGAVNLAGQGWRAGVVRQTAILSWACAALASQRFGLPPDSNCVAALDTIRPFAAGAWIRSTPGAKPTFTEAVNRVQAA